MSVTRILAIATLSTLVLFSCTKEDIGPVPPSPTLEDIETTIDEDDITNERQLEGFHVFMEFAEAELTPCGNSFHVDVRVGDLPAVGSFNYEIRNAETNELVDSGTIGHSNYTNAVLQPCTDYKFKFFGTPNAPNNSITQTVSSDGCGGLFSC